MAAQTYTAKEKDTLSNIAKQYGVKVSDVSGYRSGNPNLIHPGEVLTIGGGTTAPTTLPLTQVPGYKAPTTTTTGVKPLTQAPGYQTLITQVTTQPPIVTTSSTPKVGTSQIDAGKTAIKELTAMGVNTDINTIRSNWSKFGLNTKLGQWIGSTTQWNAYSKYAKDELERIGAGIKEVGTKVTSLQEQMAGDTTQPQVTTQPPVGGTADTGGTALTADQLNQVQLSDIDIGDIIAGIETEGTPETVIAGEQAKLLTDQEKASATQALNAYQQQMAKAGMAFSSIRSSGEAQIAAESLARQSGINLDLASKIVDAARREQTSRINANQAAINARDTALRSMGYAIDPLTGTLQKTLEREKFEELEPTEPIYRSVQGGLYDVTNRTWIIEPLDENMADFTDQEKRKLEQANLLNAPREAQLDYLYGETAGAITTLDELAKAGYTRRGASDGGFNFYKNGQLTSAEKIVEGTGVSLSVLLSGSTNPSDIERLQVIVDPFQQAIQRALNAAMEGK